MGSDKRREAAKNIEEFERSLHGLLQSKKIRTPVGLIGRRVEKNPFDEQFTSKLRELAMIRADTAKLN